MFYTIVVYVVCNSYTTLVYMLCNYYTIVVYVLHNKEKAPPGKG